MAAINLVHRPGRARPAADGRGHAGPPTRRATDWPPASSASPRSAHRCCAASGRTPSSRSARAARCSPSGLVLVVPVPVGGLGARSARPRRCGRGERRGRRHRRAAGDVSDEVRATVLGINDTVIIAAALVGSLVAPVAVELVGGALLLCGLAAARSWCVAGLAGRAPSVTPSRDHAAGYRRGRPVWRHMRPARPRRPPLTDGRTAPRRACSALVTAPSLDRRAARHAADESRRRSTACRALRAAGR